MAHARAAADVYEETRAIDSLCTGLLYGPTPAAEAAERCRMLLGDAKGRPATQANVLASLAELEAMLGHLDEARDAYGRARAIYEELGLRMPLAGLTTIGAELELLAGDPVAAEAEARRGMELLEGSGLEAELVPLVAEALLAQGRDDGGRRACWPAPSPTHTASRGRFACGQREPGSSPVRARRRPRSQTPRTRWTALLHSTT